MRTLIRQSIVILSLAAAFMLIMVSVAQAQPDQGNGSDDGARDSRSMSANAGSAENDPEDQIDATEPRIDMTELQSRLEYPEQAKIQNIEGMVVIRVLVDDRGHPLDAVVEHSDSDLLAAAARKALMESTFVPARQNGQPVTVWVAVPVTFKLQREPQAR